MSLAIDTNRIEAVLLANEWIDVEPGSFDLDAYEFMNGDHCVHGGGKSGVCATGFTFRIAKSFATAGRQVSGPLTSIQAVRELAAGSEPKFG